MNEEKELKESADLVDIREVSVDRSLPKPERVSEYVRQIRDPYRFRYGDLIVRVKYTNDGATLEDCLTRLFS